MTINLYAKYMFVIAGFLAETLLLLTYKSCNTKFVHVNAISNTEYSIIVCRTLAFVCLATRYSMFLRWNFRANTDAIQFAKQYKLNMFIQNDPNSIEIGTLKHDEQNTVTGSFRTLYQKYMYTVYIKISR